MKTFNRWLKVFWCIFLAVVFTHPLWIYYTSFNARVFVGTFDAGLFNAAVITTNDNTVTLGQTETEEIISCFNLNVVGVTDRYDWLATGGCGGYHFNKDFGIKFIGGDAEAMAIGFGICDQPRQKAIDKEFIIWSNDFKESFVFPYKYYLLEGYDWEKLSAVLEKYTDIEGER